MLTRTIRWVRANLIRREKYVHTFDYHSISSRWVTVCTLLAVARLPHRKKQLGYKRRPLTKPSCWRYLHITADHIDRHCGLIAYSYSFAKVSQKVEEWSTRAKLHAKRPG